MAGLPPDGTLLIQQNDGIVSLFDRYTEEVYASFDPLNANQMCITQGLIWHDERLTDEQRSFASFWSGYFYAHATMRNDPTKDEE